MELEELKQEIKENLKEEFPEYFLLKKEYKEYGENTIFFLNKESISVEYDVDHFLEGDNDYQEDILKKGYKDISLWSVFVTTSTLDFICYNLNIFLREEPSYSYTYATKDVYKEYQLLRKSIFDSEVKEFENRVNNVGEIIDLINSYTIEYEFEQYLSYIDKEMLNLFMYEATLDEYLREIMFKKIKNLTEEEMDYVYDLFIKKAREDYVDENDYEIDF